MDCIEQASEGRASSSPLTARWPPLTGATPPKVHDGWMWDLTVPGNNDHDFYVPSIRHDSRPSSTTAQRAASRAAAEVYTLRDPETGAVVRTGRATSLAERALAHARTPELSPFRFQVEYRTNDFNTQVGLERMLYEGYSGSPVKVQADYR